MTFSPTSWKAEDGLLELERFDLEEDLGLFLRTAWPHIVNAEFVDGWVIDAIAEHLQAVCDGDIRRLIINLPPRTLKPVRGDAWIPTRELGLVPLQDVRPGMHVLTHKARYRRVLAVQSQGSLPVQRLESRKGYSVFAAPDHPFLTVDGWRPLRDVNRDDVIGLVAQYEAIGAPTISVEEARLLGYLVGDGACHGSPNVTVADEIEAADIRHVIDACGFESADQVYRLTKTGGSLHRIVVKAKGGSTHSRLKGDYGPVRHFLIRHNLWKMSSYTKMVPLAVMQGTDDIVRNFIGAYWACDGTLYTRGVKRDGTERDDVVIRCDSVNRGFLVQMQVLMLRLGIVSRLRKKTIKMKTKKQGETYTSYFLEIADQDNAWKFAATIPMHHAKADKLAKYRKRRFDFDRTLFGDVVESKEDGGVGECFCLSVEEDESFVANGFAVHNSTLTSIMFPAWVWAQRFKSHTSGPGVKFLHASHSEALALRDSRECRRLIETKWFQKLWGGRMQFRTDMNTMHRWGFDSGGERLIKPISAGVTGEGYDCFGPGTPVTTIRFGIPLRVPIEEVKIGEIVLSHDNATGRLVEDHVIATRRQEDREVILLRTIGGRSIHCTPDHRLCKQVTEDHLKTAGWSEAWERVTQGHWVEAHSLKRGDIIRGEHHDHIVDDVEKTFANTDVYDLQTERFHNFFANSILAHNCAIIDDPNSAADMSSEVKPETVIEWWETTMSTRMNDPKRSAHIIIQQRLSHVDLTGHILDKHPEDYTTLILPMHYDPSRVSVTSIGWVDPRTKPGELLWPERFGEKEVFALQRDLGPWSSPGQLEQLPTPKGGGIVKTEWWNTWDTKQFPRLDYIVAGLDSAYTEKKENDPSAMTVWGVFSVDGPELFQVPEKAILRDGVAIFGGARRIQRPAEQHPKVILMDAWQDRLDFNTLVTKVAQTCRKHKVDKLLIENKASGISVAQEFRRQFQDMNLTVQLVDPRGRDKVERLHAVVPLFAPALDINGNAMVDANGNIKFPGVVWAPDTDYARMVINQVSDFPKGKFDDLVDSTALCLGHLRLINMLKRTEEWSVEEGASMSWHGENPGPIYPT